MTTIKPNYSFIKVDPSGYYVIGKKLSSHNGKNYIEHKIINGKHNYSLEITKSEAKKYFRGY